MASKENREKNPSPDVEGGFFLQILEDMEKKNEQMRTFSGSIEGPFSLKAKLMCKIRMGFQEREIK